MGEGVGVDLGVGFGVGLGLGVGVRVGIGVGTTTFMSFFTTDVLRIIPAIPAKKIIPTKNLK